MRENFDSELKRIESLKCNTKRYTSMLDDMSTAYISSSEYGHLDTSLMVVRSTRKLLRSQGYSTEEINDYLLENSYLSKTQIRKLRLQSIDDIEYTKEIADTRPALFTERTTTDLIIDGLKNRPELLASLQKGQAREVIAKKFHIPNTTLLINFYQKHKDIIDD